MSPEAGLLVELAATISDREPIDWEAHQAAADNDELRRRLARLRVVADLLRAHDSFRDQVDLESRQNSESTVSVFGRDESRPADPEPRPRPPDGNAMWPGRILGDRYRIERRFGVGGMGEVWLAFDLKLCVDVALKALRPETVTPRRRELLRREVRAARQVVSPHVCRIYDLVEIDGSELISMEAVDGVDLAKHLRSHGPLDLREASQVASQLLAGLQAIHEAGVVHRDLKPANVMITPAGRVVVMDFGIAKEPDETTGDGAIVGTPAYMAPEQLRGEPVDARTDLYAAGLVLLELVTPSRDTPNRDPLRTYQGPWRDALGRALSVDPGGRFASAREFGRAMETATLRSGIRDEHCPFPGLAAFTEADTRFFFGRETDVESLVKKLKRLHMTAVVGPSGVGKSSFVRAGLIPALPSGWAHVICSPGSAPFESLGQCLAVRLGRDPQLLPSLARITEPDLAVALFRSWRQSVTDAVLIVDQFEELFTQHPEDVQARFAELLSRLTLEADVRILLAMRDDFLFRCHAHPGLRPILTELALLPPLQGADLRRALVHPALASGYRFEDELVDEIVGEVERERGALPLLAFTASRLWEHRDRENGLLPRQAYETIGGVAGSLAQHAEATLDHIGLGRLAIVREIFRALVTSQGTRLSRERNELLSVVKERRAAEDTLDKLVEARLLTSFESADPKDPEHRLQRVELIHESLLSHWPRLVRWRTQDADGAQFRDQLRQAAQLWEESGRPEDMLWTGAVYQEYRLWRTRFPGALTELEEAFAGAGHARVRQQRRRRNIALASVLTILGVALAITITLWQRSERAQQRAVIEAKRAEAEKLYTLAQNDQSVSNALAYTTTAVELSDQPAYRRFALKLLLRTPVPFRLPILPKSHNAHPTEISPDGKWLVFGWSDGGAVQVYPLEGGEPRVIGRHDNEVIATRFSDDSSLLVTTAYDAKAKIWKFPEGTLLRTLTVGELTLPFLRGTDRLLTYELTQGERPTWRAWSLSRGDGELLGRTGAVLNDLSMATAPDVDPSGRWAVVGIGQELVVFDLNELDKGPVRILGSHPDPIRCARFAPDGNRVASFDDEGGVRLWSFASTNRKPLRVLQGGQRAFGAEFGQNGARLVGGGMGARLWDMESPGTEPEVLDDGNWKFQFAMHPKGEWVVSTGIQTLLEAWPISLTLPITLVGGSTSGDVRGIQFAPDGSWIAASSHSGYDIRRFKLDGARIGEPESFFREKDLGFHGLIRDDAGNTLVSMVVDSTRGNGTAVQVSLADGRIRTSPLGGWNYVVDATGRFVASTVSKAEGNVLRVWDIRTGEIRELGMNGGSVVGFARDGRLLSRDAAGLQVWDLATGKHIPGWTVDEGTTARLCPDRETMLLHAKDGSVSFRRLDGSEARRSPAVVRRDGLMGLTTDPKCEILAFGRKNGDVEVVRAGTGETHLLPIHDGSVSALAVDPLGRWIASAGGDGIKLSAIPSGRSILGARRDEFLRWVRSFANVRAVKDERQLTGYAIEASGIPDWEHPPRW